MTLCQAEEHEGAENEGLNEYNDLVKKQVYVNDACIDLREWDYIWSLWVASFCERLPP